MRQIQLTQGKVTLVDDTEYGFLNRYKWCANKIGCTYYAVRGKDHIYMHRIILKAPSRVEVDHVNSDTLDNRRMNLRLCNSCENNRHRRLSCINKTGFKGVSRTTKNPKNPYVAYISVDNRNINLGYYHTAEQAAKSYDSAALKHFGRFALTNEMMGLFG